MNRYIGAPAALALFLAFCSACNDKGEIQVTPSLNQNQGAAASRDSGAGLRAGSTSDADRNVYFERVSMRAGKPHRWVGMGFLHQGANNDRAFGFRFAAEEPLADGSRFSPAPDGVIYLQSNGAPSGKLIKVNPSTLAQTELMTVSDGMKKLASSPDGSLLAWVDEQGNAMSVLASRDAPIRLNLAGRGARALFVDGAGDVVVSGEAWTAVFQRKSLESPVFIEGTGDEVAVSPGGSRVAAIDRGQGALMVRSVERAQDPWNSVLLADPAPTELNWYASNQISYLAPGTSETSLALKSLDIDTGKSEPISAVPLPAGLAGQTSKIICPAWSGDRVYFSAMDNQTLAIFVSQKKAGTWVTRVFARPSSADEGYVCPKTLSAGGAT